VERIRPLYFNRLVGCDTRVVIELGARHLFARGLLAKEKCGRIGREKQRKEEKSTCTSMSKNGTP
jgi:hypothetical protein